jgi:ATP-binding cassette subfamily D (ALD) protein 4
LIVIGYFFVGYLVSKLIMSPIVRIVFNQEKLEGDFRFAHIRVRSYAEAIALFDGAERERDDAEKTFTELLKNKFRLMRWQWSLNSASQIFTYVGR